MSCNHDHDHDHGHHHHGHGCGHHHGNDEHPLNERLMTSPHVAIIGLGLMGASLAAALKGSTATGPIMGYDADAASLSFCHERGYIDEAAASAEAAVADADLVVLAVPIAALGEVAKAIAPALKPGVVVTDLSSVKQEAVLSILPHLPGDAVLVPGHPIAGASVHGAKAARADLFDGKLTVLTPEKGKTPHYAIAATARLWEAVGARTERMSPQNHDIIYGYVSHLPQLLAYAACQTLADESLPAETVSDAFRRFIRLGSSDPAIWVDIITANHDPVRHALAHALATLEHMEKEFAAGESHGAVSEDSPYVTTRYFPLLASGAAISVITQFETQNNIRLANYAGTGLRDFTAPVASDPSQDLEAISHCYAHVARCLSRYIQTLRDLHLTLGDPSAMGKRRLLEQFTHFQSQHALLEKRLAEQAA